MKSKHPIECHVIGDCIVWLSDFFYLIETTFSVFATKCEQTNNKIYWIIRSNISVEYREREQ